MNSEALHPQNPSRQLHEGQGIYNYLRANHITQTQLASKLNVKPHTVAIYCQSNRLHRRIIQRILTALKVDYQAVFGQETRPHDGQRLQEYLKRNNISGVALATLLGRTPANVSSYFNTEHLRDSVVESILKALNATYEQVFDYQAEVKPVESIADVVPVDPQPEAQIDAKPIEPYPVVNHATAVQTVLSQQLSQWLGLLAELEANKAPLAQQRFCKQQVSHLELSQSAYYDRFQNE